MVHEMPQYRLGERMLGDSEYLLMSDVNPNSFDARYFGLIAGLQIQHVVEPFFTWGKNVLNYEELAVMLIFTIAFFVLISRLPLLLAGIITGSSIGSTAGIGSYGAGGFMAAAGTAAAVASYGGTLAAGRLTAARSAGTDALRSAIEKGQAQESSGMNNISQGRGK
jgi:type IV secretion system protein TrbL